MSNRLGMAAQLAGQSLRFGWYFALNRVVEWRTSQLGLTRRYKAQRPVPSLQELLADQAQLLVSDALAVRDGIYPPMDDEAASPLHHLMRVQQMLADLPMAASRRACNDASTAKAEAAALGVPEYYVQDFHFQTGGYLSEGSARLYDVQVETLFMGAAGPMRRAALRPVAEFMRGRDQRHVALLDVACGTGRFLRQVRLAYPAMQLKGLDLSRSYLEEAARQFEGLRAPELIAAPGYEQEGAQRALEILNAGDFFGEIAALTGVPRTADVVTEQPTTVLQVPAGTLQQMIADPWMRRYILNRMTERLVRLDLIDLPRFPSLDQQTLRELRTPESQPAPGPQPVPAVG